MSCSIYGLKFLINTCCRYYGKNMKNSKDVKLLEEITRETSSIAFDTNVVDFLPMMRWFGFKDVERKLVSIQQKRDRFMQQVIQEHRQITQSNDYTSSPTKKKAMVEVLLDLQRSEPEYYTDENIKNLLLVRSINFRTNR